MVAPRPYLDMTPQRTEKMGTTATESATTAAAPDRHQSAAQNIGIWFQARQKAIGFALGAIVLLVLVGWYMVESGKRKHAQAMDALDQARASMESGNYPEASAAFQRVTQVYSGTDAAYEAVLALNQVRLLSGQPQLAVEELTKFVASNPPAPYNSAAHSHLAMALENAGRIADATPEYLKAAELATEPYRKIDAILNAARTYRITGKKAEAVALLEKVIKDYKETEPGIAEAKVRLAELQ